MSQKQQFDPDLKLVCEKTVAELKRISSDPDWFEELLGAYKDQTQTHITSLTQAIEKNAKQQGLDLAHTLKSSNLQVGAQRLGETFRQLETMLEEDNFSDAQKACECLPDLFHKTFEELRSNFTEGLEP